MRKKLNIDVEKGALHKQLGVPQGSPIPINLIEQKLKTAPKGSKLQKRLIFALNFKRIAARRKKS